MRRPATTATTAVQISSANVDAVGIEHKPSTGPSGRLIATAAGGAGLWVVAWTAIQVQQGAGWALPLVSAFP